MSWLSKGIALNSQRLSKRLERLAVGFGRIGLRAAWMPATFIYHFADHPIYRPLTQALLSGVEEGEWDGFTSTIALVEILVKPLALGRQDIARKYESLLENFPNLGIVDLGRIVVRQAARLRAEYRIRPPDALQANASLIHAADAFIAKDRLLERLRLDG